MWANSSSNVTKLINASSAHAFFAGGGREFKAGEKRGKKKERKERSVRRNGGKEGTHK
jgi:hypothetical protein